MILNVRPAETLTGVVDLPASKSYSIRAFVIAACGGNSVIIRPSNCDDALVAIRTARRLGATVQEFKKGYWKVTPSRRQVKSFNIDVGESGTVLRFLLPLAALRFSQARITGRGTLVGRPNHHLAAALRKMGFHIRGTGPKESVPITIKGGHFDGGQIQVDGSLSSQFISAFLIACSGLSAETRLKISGKKMVSQTYVTMTRQILALTGIRIRKKGERELIIPAGQQFQGLKNFIVPSDYGLAAFLLAAASLIPSSIQLKGALGDHLVQSDGEILAFLKRMGIRFSKTDSSLRISGPFMFKGGEFSLKNCPDLVPIMAVLALFAQGRTRLYDIHHARAKESDRISDLRRELLKVGAQVVEKDNEMLIYPQKTYKSGCLLDPHHDHRLAMAFAILGLKIAVRIKDIECVSKSYPDFVRDLKKLSARVSRG